MRNLRLYNTDAAFKTDERTVNNVDGNDVETVIPGVSRTKDQRKTYFNPKDKEILYKDIMLYHSAHGWAISGTQATSATVRYFADTTPEIYVNADVGGLENLVPEKTYSKITVPSTLVTSITFNYVPRDEDLKIKCEYQIASTSAATKILNSSSGVRYIEIDGETLDEIPVNFNFDSTGNHTLKFFFSGKTIGQAFTGVTALTSVSISDEFGMIEIPNSAFAGCTYLSSVRIPNTVTGIGDYSFYRCGSLTSVSIPNSVKTLGSYCFSYCYTTSGTGLQSITIPDSVTSIGSAAFYWSLQLKNVVLSNSLTVLPSSVFSTCSGLTSISIPDSITGIDNYCFSYNNSLTSVTFGTGLTSIGSSAFYSNYKLVGVESRAVTAPSITSNSTFYLNTKTNGKLYYPQGSDYSSWLRSGSSYKGCLGYWGFTGQEV